ncbi:hypothetical protein D0Z00_003648 [Geotrichum galactomycetum]|uniref:Uncharacterized protein n=1 Tax=Geotrichum galactomycetum TaxID=27317 RepID=A0ACB6V0Q9_9ASCO|nr:hypothetical protein D0Z00_003648 [Geotrichum candidum]
MRIKKKHTSGAAKNFITRSQAVRKLQISLADFRRLCIFKGIYPREPRNKKKANKGSSAPVTFYYAKDIQYLMHEPVLNKFREHKIFARKLTRALGRGDLGDAKRLDENRPKYKLDHVIKQRYPTFLDALRDLDDPLSMLFLFSIMPATDLVSSKVVRDADRLCHQWMAYVAREKLLRKVFVSIKGVYYEAIVRGQEVRWLVPFKFPQNIPSDIDFRIMLTFLEFYTTLLQFTLYRLYTESGLVYPPQINKEKINGVGGLSAFILESREAEGAKSLLPSVESLKSSGDHDEEANEISSSAMEKIVKLNAASKDEKEDFVDVEEEEDLEDGDKLDTFEAAPATENNVSDVLAQPASSEDSVSNLFSKFTFFVGREVPLDILELLVLAFGGNVISESAIDELIANNDEDDESASKKAKMPDLSKVTHQICDRPTIANKVPGRTYVQPQWIFDSINKGKLVSVSDYAPGETLPPHLSPWGDGAGYDPEADVSEAEDDEEEEDEEIEVKPGDEDHEDEDEEDDVLAQQRELEKESAGVTFTEASKADNKKKASKKRAAVDQEKEEKELKMMMMTNKQKKLYKKMQYGIDKKEARTEELKKKKRKLEQTKAKLNGKK